MSRIPIPSISQAVAVLLLVGSAALAPASDRPDGWRGGSHELFRRDELAIAGISLHRETEREIFIGGILLPADRQVADPLNMPPPRAMEYRIAAPRLSARGFLTSILLQAELAAHQNPPQSVVSALNVINRNLKGSLKRGDQFVIYHSRQDETVFLLNDLELHRVSGSAAFSFFLNGWAGEDAASTFREPLLSGAPDEGLAGRFRELEPSVDRVAIVRGWLAVPPGAERGPGLPQTTRRPAESYRPLEAPAPNAADANARGPRDAVF
jgi:hypothetical protein